MEITTAEDHLCNRLTQGRGGKTVENGEFITTVASCTDEPLLHFAAMQCDHIAVF